MTLTTWKDYVASYLTDALGGHGVAYVTSLAFDSSGHLSTQFMLVATGGVNQDDLAGLLVAGSSSACSPLYASSAFYFTGSINVSTASTHHAVAALSSNASRNWCGSQYTLSFSDDCAGACNLANIPIQLGVAGAQLHTAPP
eukprot:2810471-Prymnesium_polylepis.1